MGFKKQEINNYLVYDTPIENVFISEFCKNAPGDYVKVYLLGYMYANANKVFDNEMLSRALALSIDEVEKAWDYWAELKIVNKYIKDPKHPKDYDIEFVCIKEKFQSLKEQKENRVLSNKDLEELLSAIEKRTGRLLEIKEPEMVVAWIKDLSYNEACILFAYDYCIKNGYSDRPKYVDKVLREWKNRGLDNKEQIEDYLSDMDKRYVFYKAVFKELGFRRNPTEAEKDIMNSWVEKYDLSLEDVKKACKKTTGISNPNINYLNAVLTASSEDEKKITAEKKSIEDIYEAIRRKNELLTKEKRRAIYAKVSELEPICNKIKELSFEISKNILRGSSGKNELEKNRELIKELIEKKRSLLLLNGFNENDLETIYSCNKCNDTGLLDDNTRCECYQLRIKEINSFE